MMFVFFKQKTAYEMRISDWSSDVCSSDLPPPRRSAAGRRHRRRDRARPLDRPDALCRAARPGQGVPDRVADADRWRPHDNRARTDAADDRIAAQGNARNLRSEEHTSELQSLMRISYAVFCLKKKNKKVNT